MAILHPSFWGRRAVVVTGGGGFLGRVVVERLRALGCERIGIPRQAEFDLTRPDAIDAMFDRMRPDLVIHLAAACGGIGLNRDRPGELFYRNAIMGVQLMEAARRRRIERFVAVGTVCAYPKLTATPFREPDLWSGYPEETNAPYGLAKKMLLVQAQAYRQQYGFDAVFLLPANLYGPDDNFDLATSHVIPALVRKCVEARRRGEPRVICWGSGEASREFLYVDDAAVAILLASEHYRSSEPLNIGSGQEIRIRELAQQIAGLAGFAGELSWDASKPDGQLRRCLDVSRAREELGFFAEVRLDEGLRRTIAWYEAQTAMRSDRFLES